MIQSRILKIVCFIFFGAHHMLLANDNTPRKITVNEKTLLLVFVTDDGYLVTAYTLLRILMK